MSKSFTPPTLPQEDRWPKPSEVLRGWFSKLVADYHPDKGSSGQDIEPAAQNQAENFGEDSNQSTGTPGTGAMGTVMQWMRLGLPQLNCPMQSVSRPAMACEFEVLLNERQYSSGVERAVEALALVTQVEELLSVYRPQSQFSKVNRFGAERAVGVDALTLEIIQLAIDIHHCTAGCFDITAGSLSEAWGFSRREGKMPTQQQIEEALSLVGSQLIKLDESAKTVSLAKDGVKLNPGGIGKGYALDLVANSLLRAGINDFMIHGGLSSIVARGNRQSLNSDWVVALKHPWRTEELLETFALRNQALGTSGSGKQFFHFGGKRYSHLIDPRTGWPAQQMMSVTVVCPSCAIADALATGLFVMGFDQAKQFCDDNPEVAALLIHIDPKSGSQRIDRCNWQLVE